LRGKNIGGWMGACKMTDIATEKISWNLPGSPARHPAGLMAASGRRRHRHGRSSRREGSHENGGQAAG